MNGVSDWHRVEIADDQTWEEWHYDVVAEGEDGMQPASLRIWRHENGPFEVALQFASGERCKMKPTTRTDTNGAKLEVLKRMR